ncbi:MAG: hypothetical protein F6K40_09835 [Okeania sp. SIO3I5]|uniref:hypothetical protein n=1 Tax=Okeania sp. SIO3I5 TaxID=2607805 RepID=UPI0013B84C48|nr:hypothetical protein [Okeania sp. SIO3I5]NEQ36559.1 hypothetical protein [Okeania sp. SIO3I5]
MTKLLEEAIAALAQLPESEQDGIASLILEKIASEKSHTEPVAKPFWQKIQEIGAQVPREEWEKLPTDFARNFESYMYGLPTEE